MTNITIDTSALIAVLTHEPSKDRIVQITIDGQVFMLTPITVKKSPLDVQSVPLDLTAEEIISFVHEGRR